LKEKVFSLQLAHIFRITVKDAVKVSATRMKTRRWDTRESGDTPFLKDVSQQVPRYVISFTEKKSSRVYPAQKGHWHEVVLRTGPA
jgi:hypothetical protein